MVELVDTLVLEASARASRFESELGHHIKTYCIGRVARSVLKVAPISVFLYGGLAHLGERLLCKQ